MVTIPNMLDITHPKDIFVQRLQVVGAGGGGRRAGDHGDGPFGTDGGPGRWCARRRPSASAAFTLYRGACRSCCLIPEFEVIKVTKPNPTPIHLTQLGGGHTLHPITG